LTWTSDLEVPYHFWNPSVSSLSIFCCHLLLSSSVVIRNCDFWTNDNFWLKLQIIMCPTILENPEYPLSETGGVIFHCNHLLSLSSSEICQESQFLISKIWKISITNLNLLGQLNTDPELVSEIHQWHCLVDFFLKYISVNVWWIFSELHWISRSMDILGGQLGYCCAWAEGPSHGLMGPQPPAGLTRRHA
jgi:hypothetical protein